jgi:hypothetical protein
MHRATKITKSPFSTSVNEAALLAGGNLSSGLLRWSALLLQIVAGICVLHERTQSGSPMLYMIIERFHPHHLRTLYQRFDEKGRMLPEGVRYINSWIDENVTVCYQVMESESIEKLQEWVGRWNDLADFEIIPLITSAQAKEKVLGGK